MQIRPATPADLALLAEIDGTVESSRYLHLERGGEGLAASWRLEDRPLRQKLIEPNRLSDETAFLARQIVTGVDEGLALVAEYDEGIVAMLVAQERPGAQTLHVHDLRIDYDLRRQGMGTALIYQVIGLARERELRAVSTETLTNNDPANQLLAKCGFELSGVDTRRHSNHDVVKEAATLLWYAPLD
jgi:ribosomal protein S18 acetylase RimI-like enzyme